MLLTDKAIIVLDQTSRMFKVDKSDILSRSQHRHISETRQVVWYVLRDYYTEAQIAAMFKRGRSTVYSGIEHAYDLIRVDEDFQYKVNIIEENIQTQILWEEQ